MLSPEGRLQIRDQLTGALRAESPTPVLAAHGFTCSMVTVDARGRLFHNNSLGAGGSAADLRVFDSALQPEWSLSITGMSQGGPSVASDGSLVLAGTGVVRRYWTPTCAQADLNCDGRVDGVDLTALLAAWGQPGPTDLDGNGTTDGLDLSVVLAAWGP